MPNHTSRQMCILLKDSEMDVLEGPGNSPNPNPVQKLRAVIEQLFQKEDCSKMTKLISAVNRVWYYDDELANMCSTLVESVPHLVQEL